MVKFHDLTNKKFNKLTVLHKSDIRIQRSISWICKCDCGNIITVSSCALVTNNTKSCGCLRFKYEREEKLLKYFNSVRCSAVRRKIDFQIELQDLYNQFDKQDGICVYTGLKLSLPFESNDLCASLDRKNSSLGYTVDNIQWVLKEVNAMKSNMSEDKFIWLCNLISIDKQVFCLWDNDKKEVRL